MKMTEAFSWRRGEILADSRLRHGIYAVRLRADGKWREGVASFGRRPTFDNGRPLLETYVFDFSGDLYGETLPVTLVTFLRPEQKFDSLAEYCSEAYELGYNMLWQGTPDD